MKKEKILLGKLLLAAVVVEVASIQLNGNRYEDIYIVVQDKIQDNSELLERIQEAFTDASALLFNATKNRVYFGKIKILIPKSWSTKTHYKQRPSLSNLETYITVDRGNVDFPHVRRKSNLCGAEGHYMFLTPEFFLQNDRTNWGKHDHVIVHEWGHLRWGLYDEYADTYGRLPKFYQAGGRWHPTRCSEKLEGVIGIGDTCKTTLAETFCNIYNGRKKLHSSCNFCPLQEQTVGTSLMGYQYIDSLTMFCDSDDVSVEESRRHNKLARNAQNLFCDSKSAWEVMREHSDFSSNTGTLPDSTNTVPEFEIIQEGVGYRVFVLDVSGSMSGTRIQTQYQTCLYIIQEILSEGSWLGIVSFSSVANKLHALTQINSQADRDSLKAKIPNMAGGGTCIGCGIERAIDMLREKLGDPEYGEIILVTDGENNEGNLPASRQIAINSKVLIHTVAIDQAADNILVDIATETGGKNFAYLQTGSISFASAFVEIISSGLTSAASEPTTLVSEKIDSIPSSTLSFRFSIEDGLGNETSVSVLTQSSTNIQLEISGPNNYNSTKYANSNTISATIPGDALVGEYTVKVITARNQRIEYYVKSFPVSSDVIRVTGRLSKSTIDLSTRELPVVFADVTKSYAPVLNATVYARAETGTSACDIRLKDNGQDPDSFSNDGTYSGYLLQECLSNGRVNIKLNATGNDGETMISKGLGGSVNPSADTNYTEMVNGSFQRVTTVKELTLLNYSAVAGSDVIPPGRITDVTIHNIKTEATAYGESRNFTLKWTAPGNNMNIGNASRYEFKISDNQSLLISDFNSAENLTMINESIVPQPSGSIEALDLVVNAEKSYTETAFFAIRAIDNAGNVGKVSNVISITVAKGYRAAAAPGIVGDVDFGSSDTEQQSLQANEDENKSRIIIGVSVTVGVLLILAAVLVYILKVKKKKMLVDDSAIGSRSSISSISTISSISSKMKNPDNNLKNKRNKSVSSISSEDVDKSISGTDMKSEEYSVVDIEEGDFESKTVMSHITSPTLKPSKLTAPPFLMSNMAEAVQRELDYSKDDPLFGGIDNSVFKDPHVVVADPDKKTEILAQYPELPFGTHNENAERDHPPPNMAPHILSPEEYGVGKKRFSFPAPFSGVADDFNVAMPDRECLEEILANLDSQCEEENSESQWSTETSDLF